MSNEHRFAHVRILASAGSGKTYQLATRYLALALREVPVETILASTFTRAAAGEIRDRILNRLAEAAADDGKRRELAEAVELPGLSQADLLRLLREMTSKLNRLQIRTLDSFFASLVRSFALELDIPVGAQIIDEDATGRLRWDALRRMLDTDDTDHLINLLRRLTQGVSGRSVVQSLEKDIDALLETAREAAPGAWDALGHRAVLDADALGAAMTRLRSLALSGAQKKAHAADCACAAREQWDVLVSKGLAGAIARGKDSYWRELIGQDLVEAYEPILKHALGEMWNALSDQTSATGQLLERFEEHLAVMQRRGRLLTFSDLTAALSRGGEAMTYEDLCFRIDARIHHVLLDEFQDTSVSQWRAIDPIVREIVSDGTGSRTFFCVGDVKQSIYGWRNACPEIFDEIPNLLRGADGTTAVEDRSLAMSRRSSPVVIMAVNQVFHDLANNMALRDDAEAAQRFAGGFEEHATVHEQLPGYVELRTAARPSGEGKSDVVRYRQVADAVAALNEAAPNISIGILTRSNGAVSRLLYELKRVGIEAAGRGGGPLTDANPVNAVLDLIALADHPDDTIAAFHVAGSPLGAVLKLSDFADTKQRRAVSRAVRRALMHRGYARTIATWVADVAPACGDREYRRLRELIDLGAEFDVRYEPRPETFVRFVEERRVADAEPAPVNVMTVHQSKGMEFDAVFLPELEVNLASEGMVVYERDSDAGPVGPFSKLCRWVRGEQREALPELSPMFDDYRARVVRESLSLLYVAITRTRQGLYMLIDPPNLLKGGKPSSSIPKTLAGIVRSAMAGSSPPQDNAVIVQHGDSNWYAMDPGDDKLVADKPVADKPQETRPAATSIVLAPSAVGPRHAGAAASASAVGHNHGLLRSMLTLPDADALETGVAIHALLERLIWIETFDLPMADLDRIVARVAPRRSAAWRAEVIASFETSLRRPEIRSKLSRASAVGQEPTAAATTVLTVLTEHPFARLSDGAVQRGSIDRLVVSSDANGTPRAATVIDFKTDRVDASDVEARADLYREQLRVYQTAAAEMLGLDPDAVETVLLFLHSGVAVDLAKGASLFG